MKSVKVLLFTLAVMLSAPVLAQSPTPSNMEIVRQKVKADKKLLVAANMSLTEAEAKRFWPIYDAYQADLEKINRQQAAAVAMYAEAYVKGSVPDDVSKKVLSETLAAEEAETKLKRAYLPKLEKAVSGTKAVRYLQIENKIRAIIRYDLAAEIPLVD